MQILQTRRYFLSGAALAGAAALLPARRGSAEPDLETTSVRLGKTPVICFAPQYVCEDLLRMEGFTDIRYVDTKTSSFGQGLAEGKYDFASNVTAQNVVFVDSGLPITLVAGIHAGCYELFASGRSCCMRAALARSSCGRPPIGRGRNISAARWRPSATMWPGTRLPPSE